MIAVSDNGASAEGGPSGSVNELQFLNNIEEDIEDNLEAMDALGGPEYYNHYPMGWAWAGDTPFRRWKRETYRGGVSDPMVVHWPDGIDAQDEIRDQFVHAIDVVPTVLEAIGIDAPEEIDGYSQSPIEGTSFAYTFDDPAAPEQHTDQYFEMLAYRAIYHDGWRAVKPWEFGKPITAEDLSATTIEETGWELYNLQEDFSEAHDVADEHPEKVLELAQLWWATAGTYDVLPLDGRTVERMAATGRPQVSAPRDQYVYYPGGKTVPENGAVSVLNHDHSITAEVDIPQDGTEGVLFAHGSTNGGYSLFVLDDRLHYVHNYCGIEEYQISADNEIPADVAELSMEFEVIGEPDIQNGEGAPATVRLYYDDDQVGKGELPVTIPIMIAINAGLSCGQDFVQAVTTEYEKPFTFTGDLTQVTVDVSGEPFVHHEAVVKRIMTRE